MTTIGGLLALGALALGAPTPRPATVASELSYVVATGAPLDSSTETAERRILPDYDAFAPFSFERWR